MHQQEAFYRGVNFYLNMDDKDKIDELLEQVLKGFSDYNEPWRMALTMDMWTFAMIEPPAKRVNMLGTGEQR